MGSEKVQENFSWGPGKSWNSPGFFVGKRVGTLSVNSEHATAWVDSGRVISWRVRTDRYSYYSHRAMGPPWSALLFDHLRVSCVIDTWDRYESPGRWTS